VAGETVTDSNDVLFTERGTYTNNVTVGGFADPSGATLSASDKATVEAGVAAAACPDSYQALINSLDDVDPDNNFAASILLQPQNPGLISLCTPTCVEGDGDCIVKSSSRTLCEDDCIWDSSGKCKASGVWVDGELIDNADRIPYCHEVVESITDDLGTPVKFTTSQTIEIIELSVNPYVYQTCYKSGGRKVCETICYLYPGETAAVCPRGSTVQ
jgi:hypothetical protein